MGQTSVRTRCFSEGWCVFCLDRWELVGKDLGLRTCSISHPAGFSSCVPRSKSLSSSERLFLPCGLKVHFLTHQDVEMRRGSGTGRASSQEPTATPHTPHPTITSPPRFFLDTHSSGFYLVPGSFPSLQSKYLPRQSE